MPNKKHQAEAKLWAALRDEHGCKFRELATGMTTESDRYPNLIKFSTMTSTPSVSFVVTMPQDSSMGTAFVEHYNKRETAKAKKKAKRQVRA